MGDPHLGGGGDGQGRLPAGNHIKEFLKDRVNISGQNVKVGGRVCVAVRRQEGGHGVDRGLRESGQEGPLVLPPTHLCFVTSQSMGLRRQKKRCW